MNETFSLPTALHSFAQSRALHLGLALGIAGAWLKEPNHDHDKKHDHAHHGCITSLMNVGQNPLHPKISAIFTTLVMASHFNHKLEKFIMPCMAGVSLGLQLKPIYNRSANRFTLIAASLSAIAAWSAPLLAMLGVATGVTLDLFFTAEKQGKEEIAHGCDTFSPLAGIKLPSLLSLGIESALLVGHFHHRTEKIVSPLLTGALLTLRIGKLIKVLFSKTTAADRKESFFSATLLHLTSFALFAWKSFKCPKEHYYLNVGAAFGPLILTFIQLFPSKGHSHSVWETLTGRNLGSAHLAIDMLLFAGHLNPHLHAVLPLLIGTCIGVRIGDQLPSLWKS